MSRHRQQVRPRYGRMAVLGAAVLVTLVAVLGGTGLLPTGSQQAAATTMALDRNPAPTQSAPSERLSKGAVSGTPDAVESRDSPARDVSLPAHSGTGKRVVFSQSRQRVWLVTGGKDVARTYLVSGSLYDNLDPGTFEVYSRSEQAYGIDDSGTMKYFVRFTQGDTAAIGFHDIPIDDGHLVQTVAQLGTPQSHGCIRQERPDAIALWRFAPLGTTVVVTA